MKYPFNFKHRDNTSLIFTAKDVDGDLVVTWEDEYEGDDQTNNNFTFVDAQRYIDVGLWIVQKPVEALVEPSVEVSRFTIKVEAKEAVAAVKELTEAINELGYAYSKLIEIQNRFKGN